MLRYNDVVEQTAQLSVLKDTLTAMQSAFAALYSAQQDMNSGAGLRAETIQKLAGVVEDYIDYLYKENGIIKFNTEAWKDMA